MLMPPPASRSSRGCGRSGSSRTRMGQSGAVWRPSSCGTPRNDMNASRSSPGSAFRPSCTRMAAMWPSTTGTRWHWALTGNSAGRTRASPPSTRPRILRVSRSIFSSSFAMYGTTLSVMSSEATPGYPAPEIACIVVMTTASTPKRACNGASASAIMIVEQLGLVPLNPRPGRRASIARCPALTSGISSGTSSSIRWDDELLMTGYPAAANCASTGPAMSAGRLESTMSQSSGGCGGRTCSARSADGTFPGRRHTHASPNVFPCERSDAATAVTTSWGWPSNMATSRWPTVPVAPRMPTRTCAATCLPFGRQKYHSDLDAARSGGKCGPMTGVTVRVPGTTANLGSGFDFLGMAVERWLQVRARCVDDRSAPAVVIERHGALSDLGASPEQDLIYRGFAAACRAAGRDVPDRLSFAADSDIPVSRGLGSSAAAIVAGAAAANLLLNLDLGPEALLALGTEIEGHPDNVAPAVYGGACLVLHRPAGGLLAVPIEIHAALAFVFAIPELRVETTRARAALPAAIPHATAVHAAARGAALIHGLVTADPDSLSVGLDDLLHVPYRRSLV